MGAKTKTVKGLQVIKIDQEKNELWITGAVPGAKKGLIKIKKLAEKEFKDLFENKQDKKIEKQ